MRYRTAKSTHIYLDILILIFSSDIHIKFWAFDPYYDIRKNYKGYKKKLKDIRLNIKNIISL